MPYRNIYCNKLQETKEVFIYQVEIPRLGTTQPGYKTEDFECDLMDSCKYVNSCEAWKVSR